MFYPVHTYIYRFNLVSSLYQTESFLSTLAYKSQFLCKFVNIKKTYEMDYIDINRSAWDARIETHLQSNFL